MSPEAPDPRGHTGGRVSERTIRRRRVAVLLVAALVAAGVVVVGLISCGRSTPQYVPAGAAVRQLPSTAATLPVTKGPSYKPAPAAQARLRSMPLATQAAQLFLVTVSGGSPAAAAQLGATPWGGVVLSRANASSAHGVARLTRALRRQLGRVPGDVPLLAATQEGGPDTAFPDLPPRGQSDIGDAALARSEAAAAGTALRRLGVQMTLAPLADVDIPSGAESGRLFGTDPHAVARLAAAAVAGYVQAGAIPAVGHFPGAGGASADPDQMAATVGGSLAQLRARDLIPFGAVAGSAPVMVMSNAAYAAFDGVTPASLSLQAVSLLRDQLHYQGVVMSDDLDATLDPTGDDPGSVALQALQAGDDLLYISGPPSENQAALAGILRSAQHSSDTRRLIHDALLRVLSLKAKAGLVR